MPNHRTRILYRRDGKGRRCSLGDSIASIPCRAGRVEEKADLHPILQLVLVQISLFFNSPWFKSAYSSTRPGSNQPILQLVLVQISLILCSSSSLKMQRQPFPSLLYKILVLWFGILHCTVLFSTPRKLAPQQYRLSVLYHIRIVLKYICIVQYRSWLIKKRYR